MTNHFQLSTLLTTLIVMLFVLQAEAADFPGVNTSALSANDKNAPIGFGAAVTGSGDENPVTVTTLNGLKEALAGTDKKTIYVSGSITFSGMVSIDGASNKTVYGLPGATLANTTLDTSDKNKSGILTLKNCNNIVLRNLTFLGAGAYDYDGYDNLTLTTCTNIWVDHCDFQDGVDGNLDCNNGSDNICVSWCRFRYLKAATAGGSGGSNDHRFSNLWGNGDSNAKDVDKLSTTFYACWWDEGCKQRLPRVRYGKVHVLNCLYSSKAANICIGAGYRCNVYVENSVFDLSSSAKAWQNYATSDGYRDYNIQLVGNSGASDETSSSGSYTQFVPSYEYTKMAVGDVTSVVSNSENGAGATLTFGEDEEENPTQVGTVYSWEGGSENGGTAVAYNAGDSGDSYLADDINTSHIRLRGKNDFSAQTVTITFNQALHAGDKIFVTAYRNKNVAGKQSGFKAKFEKGSSTIASSTGLEFINKNTAVLDTGEYSETPNTCEFTVPSDADGSTTMTMTRSHTATNLFITKLLITTTSDSGEGGEGNVSAETYTNTWYFGKSNGAPEFALERSDEYTYEVNGHSLVVNTDAGKLNNATRTDQWGQCNDGTTFKVPVYEGAKLTWGRYNSGSETGFTIDGQLFNEYYIAPADGTVSMSAKGIGYLSYIKIEPATLCDISGTISGADIEGASVVMTAAGNGQPYKAEVANSAFTLKVPADAYTLSLSSDVAYVVKSPASVNVTEAGSIGTITIGEASSQAVTGAITNAPAEDFTLTFTGASNTETVSCAAGATSFSTTLKPDTYTISSSTGTLSPLSQESFQVLLGSVSFNIYFPEAAVPAATQQEITVDNTLAEASANKYKTVSDALAAAKAGGIAGPIITLTSGQTYREQVIVDQANVTLKTSGMEKATITFYYGIGYTYYSLSADGYYDRDRAMTRNSIKIVDPKRWGVTVLVKSTGKGFKAQNIIFENSFNQYYTEEEVADGVTPNGTQSISYNRQLTSGQSGYKAADTKEVTERAAAIAFENSPTGCQLYNCEFRGSQDTFYSSGTLYVKNCNIIGNTDYIFGGGYVVFDNCDLTIGGYSDKETSAYITAYKDGSTLDANKCYVFRDCTVKKGSRKYTAANLGRDWGGAAASVYFFNLKNEIGSKLSYTWNDMGGGVKASTADLHIYDFDATVNANYSKAGTSGANINGVLTAEQAKARYTEVVTKLGFTPEQIYDIALDENSVYNPIRIAAANGGTGNVILTRTLTADNWSTICLPFSMTAAQVADVFGDGTKLAEFKDYDATTKGVTMATATTIAANQPYMIMVAGNVSDAKTIGSVTYADATPAQTVSGITFQGVYESGTIPSGAYFASGNNLYKSAGKSNIKPFRAYFAGLADGARLVFADDATVISDATLLNNETMNDKVYDLQGRRVTQPAKGLYVAGGKKVVVK